MKAGILALALVMTTAGIGGASAGTLENSFGNTFVIRAANGQETRASYRADGTYTMSFGATSTNGTWTQSPTQAGTEVCVTPAQGTPSCFQLSSEEKRVGDTWTQQGPDGEVVVTLVAGA